MGHRHGLSPWSPAHVDVGRRGGSSVRGASQSWRVFLASGPFPSLRWDPTNCQVKDGFGVCSTGMKSVRKWTRGNFQLVLTPTPPGHCPTILVLGFFQAFPVHLQIKPGCSGHASEVMPVALHAWARDWYGVCTPGPIQLFWSISEGSLWSPASSDWLS